MRGAIIDAARERHVRVDERPLDPEELRSADELFLSNSVFGIWPISVLGDVAFSIGTLTQSLQRDLGLYAP
jgi:4-amino-4-deoxychorismate lyase